MRSKLQSESCSFHPSSSHSLHTRQIEDMQQEQVQQAMEDDKPYTL